MKANDIIKKETEKWYDHCITSCGICTGEDIAYSLLGEKTKKNACLYDAVVRESNSHLNVLFQKEVFFPNLENEE